MESWDIEARAWAVGASTERRFHSCQCHQWGTSGDISGSHAVQYVDGFTGAIVLLSSRFSGTPCLRDVIFHTQWCAILAMVAVQWPQFVCALKKS